MLRGDHVTRSEPSTYTPMARLILSSWKGLPGNCIHAKESYEHDRIMWHHVWAVHSHIRTHLSQWVDLKMM